MSTGQHTGIYTGPPGYNLPQRLGRVLWAPMWVMALMGFVAAIIAAGVQAGSVASGASEATIQAQGHLGTGLMFLGFASVFAAISFAIARILRGVPGWRRPRPRDTRCRGAHPEDAGDCQGIRRVDDDGDDGDPRRRRHPLRHRGRHRGRDRLDRDSETTAIALEAVRRLGVAVYLVAIGLGLATITKVLRFQAIRLRELPGPTNRA